MDSTKVLFINIILGRTMSNQIDIYLKSILCRQIYEGS